MLMAFPIRLLDAETIIISSIKGNGGHAKTWIIVMHISVDNYTDKFTPRKLSVNCVYDFRRRSFHEHCICKMETVLTVVEQRIFHTKY